MKLVSYRFAGEDRFGVLKGDGVVDLKARMGGRCASLRGLLESGRLDEARTIAGQAEADHATAEIEFAMPIPDPRKILCIGRNYRAYHEVAETGDTPSYPSIFPRFIDSFVAHDQALTRPMVSEQLDYESELGVIIGAPARHVAAENWRDYVAGYTCINEGTVRDWQDKGTQNTPAKNFFHSGSMGPCMVTADQVPDPSALSIVARRNGTQVLDGGVDLMIFDIPYLIAHISKFTPLEPGDIIATGSPGGSIIQTDARDWLKPGDRLEIEIQPIGVLANTVQAE